MKTAATRKQLAMLGEVLIRAFQDDELPSLNLDTFTISISDDPMIICESNGEACCYSSENQNDEEAK